MACYSPSVDGKPDASRCPNLLGKTNGRYSELKEPRQFECRVFPAGHYLEKPAVGIPPTAPGARIEIEASVISDVTLSRSVF